jgi:hypothetical protein
METFMGTPIRINEEIYNAAKLTAKAECRSIPGQIEFWAKVGKCALENPDLPIDFIKDILISKNQDRSLAEAFSFDGHA